MGLTDSGQEIRRLFVDSGPKWRISGRNSSFVYEIPGTSLTCQKGCEYCVDSVVVGHAFFPINSSNNVVRIRIRSSASLPVESTDHKILLGEGAPTFSSIAQELTTKLRTSSRFVCTSRRRVYLPVTLGNDVSRGAGSSGHRRRRFC